MPTKHVVVTGENLSKIAAANGLRSWRSIYDAKENAAFRKKRPNPNLIKAGDEIVIPDKTPKALPAKGPFQLKKPEPLEAQVEIGFFSKEDPTEPMDGLEVQLALPPDGLSKKTVVTPKSGIISLKEPEIVEGVIRILTIRDPAEDPPKNYDKFARDCPTGHSYLIELPEDPIQAALPIQLFRSKRRPGRNLDGTTAADMLSEDYTKDQILEIRLMFGLGHDLDTTPAKVFFQEFRTMAETLFSTGALEGNIQRMIQRFEDNTGAEYSDPDMTAAVKAHAETKRYEQNIRKELKRLIDEKRGDVNQIHVNEMDPGLRPIFNTPSDIKDGLTVAINDTWAQDVDLVEYQIKRGRYKGKFRLTLFDHFGLDQPDVEKRFGMLAGFRAWFILQHLQRFGFRPFVTKMEMDYEFDGTVGK